MSKIKIARQVGWLKIVNFSKKHMKLNKSAFAYAVAIFDGALVFIAMAYSLLFGKASAIMVRVAAIHFAPYSFVGAILMLVEHAIAGFILGWVFAWLYNKFVKE